MFLEPKESFKQKIALMKLVLEINRLKKRLSKTLLQDFKINIRINLLQEAWKKIFNSFNN